MPRENRAVNERAPLGAREPDDLGQSDTREPGVPAQPAARPGHATRPAALPDEATALVEWNDGADDDPRSEIRALGPGDRTTIVSQTTSCWRARGSDHF